MTTTGTDDINTIRQIEFELEKASTDGIAV